MKYKMINPYVDAFRFQIDEEMPDWFVKAREDNVIITFPDGCCKIKTPIGIETAKKGNYIVLTPFRQITICQKEIFESMYTNKDLDLPINVEVKLDKKILNDAISFENILGLFKFHLKDKELLLGWHSNIACWTMDNLGVVDYENRNQLAQKFIKRFFDIDYDWIKLLNPNNRTYSADMGLRVGDKGYDFDLKEVKKDE